MQRTPREVEHALYHARNAAAERVQTLVLGVRRLAPLDAHLESTHECSEGVVDRIRNVARELRLGGQALHLDQLSVGLAQVPARRV